jgi:hypothetical protein
MIFGGKTLKHFGQNFVCDLKTLPYFTNFNFAYTGLDGKGISSVNLMLKFWRRAGIHDQQTSMQ